jgi:branched-chain amino acid transport system substrate-binding protein
MPITNRSSMAQITPGATYPGLTKSLDTNAPGEPWSYRPLALVNFFRPLGADDVQGTAGAKWAKRLGVKTVFVLNDDEAYGKGIANVFEVTARRFGLKISANENIDWRQPSQKSVLTRIVASGADLVYMGGVIETGAQTIVPQMREAGLVAPRVRFMGPDGLFRGRVLEGNDV